MRKYNKKRKPAQQQQKETVVAVQIIKNQNILAFHELVDSGSMTNSEDKFLYNAF